MVYNSAIEMIGNTPILKLNNMSDENSGDVYLKIEKNNPGGSIKDRAALGMIEKAEKDGLLKKGVTIVEPTSGNTGIGLAMIGRLKGYNVIIIMPENNSKERRDIIKAYGARLILTDASKGMKGAIDKALEYSKKGGYYVPQQFENEANPLKHYETTAEEIYSDIKDLDALVSGVGTGGTLIGIGKKLKEKNKNIKIIAMEPETSAVLSGEKAGAHKIQGIGGGFIPGIYEANVVDEICKVSDEDAYKYTKELALREGILVGISSGAAVCAAIRMAKKMGKGKKVLAIAPDGGEKYISTGIYE